MAISYKDMTGPDGTENNMGGTAQILYFASVQDILTWPTPAVAPANQFVMTTPFIMKSTKKFFQLYTTIDTSELEIGGNGDIDGRSFKPSLKLHYPGFSDDAVLFMNTIKNDKLALIIPLADGSMFQMGSDKFFAYANPSFKSTTTSGKGKGFDIEIMSWQPNILKYAAAIPLTPAA